jgi:hypothetical protein
MSIKSFCLFWKLTGLPSSPREYDQDHSRGFSAGKEHGNKVKKRTCRTGRPHGHPDSYLERANPDEIKRVLDPIISKSSSVLSYPPAGILVITDYLSNIKRLQEIISALDIEGAGDQISYIPLQNASASEVVKSLTRFFNSAAPMQRRQSRPGFPD